MEKDWHEAISQPKYGVRVEKDVYVKMRDGVRVAVDIYRPDAPGRFPALLASSPYGKEIQELPLPPQPQGGPLWDGEIEAGDSYYFVPRGYVHVVADARGTGYSEGEYEFLFSQNEQTDGYDLVEWIAGQPWCDGNVGLIGMSYYGAIQPYVASLRPPHLKAICPVASSTDLYRDMCYNGGVINAFFYGLWDGRGGDSGFAIGNIVSSMKKRLPAAEFERRLKELAEEPDIKMFSNYYHMVKYPKKNPMFLDVLLNPCDNEFWHERSSIYQARNINIPTFLVGAWKRGAWADAAFSLYNAVSTPHKKVIIDPSGWWDRPWVTYYEENVRWFDHWLKGIDTGIMEEPPVKLWVGGINRWRYENEWPLARTKPVKYYLRSFGGLSPEPERYMEGPDPFIQPPLYMTYDIRRLNYQTGPMPRDTEITGPVALYLHAAIDQDDTNWIVKMFDVAPNGDRALLTKGFLKASHRALDKKRSTPLYPYHTHARREPVAPGRVHEYAIALQPICNVFRAGHRLALEIRSLEHGNEGAEGQPPHSSHLCSSKTTRHDIFRNKEYPSHLLLPVIPESEG